MVLRGQFLLFTVLMPLVVHAGLGGRVENVSDDKQALKGLSQKSQTMANYSVHTIETETGVTVHEYVNTDSTVFAVTWRGVSHPDLQTLLGDYYSDFLTAEAEQPAKNRRAPRVYETKNLKMRRSGHMRDWRGLAYAPKLVPEGVDVEVLP